MCFSASQGPALRRLCPSSCSSSCYSELLLITQIPVQPPYAPKQRAGGPGLEINLVPLASLLVRVYCCCQQCSNLSSLVQQACIVYSANSFTSSFSISTFGRRSSSWSETRPLHLVVLLYSLPYPINLTVGQGSLTHGHGPGLEVAQITSVCSIGQHLVMWPP